jgi:hypothetical protein
VSATLWTGWDPVRGASSSGPPVGDDETRRFVLLALAGRGFRPPRFLTVRALAAGDPGSTVASVAASTEGLRAVWSLAYRRIAQTRDDEVDAHAIYLLGVDPPKDASDAQLDEFNDFYTNVHLVEVATRRRALRAARYELERTVLAPSNGAPRFLATYEVDEAGASQRRHVGPPYSRGPDVWQRHTTPWRIWYRTLVD